MGVLLQGYVTGSNTLPLRQLIASKSLRQLIASNSKTSRKLKSEIIIAHKITRKGRPLAQYRQICGSDHQSKRDPLRASLRVCAAAWVWRGMSSLLSPPPACCVVVVVGGVASSRRSNSPSYRSYSKRVFQRCICRQPLSFQTNSYRFKITLMYRRGDFVSLL